MTSQEKNHTRELEKELADSTLAVEALRESEFLFRESQRAAFIGSYKFNINLNNWTSSEILEQIFGIDENYHRSFDGWLDIAHPDDREMMANYFEEDVLTKQIPFNKEYRIIRKSDGAIRWVLGLGKLNFDDNGVITTMIGTIQDITDRKLQEESLRQSNELNQSLLQSIPFGMDIVDEFGNILFISNNLKKHASPVVIGQKCWELYRDDQTQCVNCPLLRGIRIGETDIYESSGVLGGKIFQISHTGMMFQGKKAMLEIFQDITEKKDIEKRVLLMAHALESISECVTVTDNSDILIYVNRSFLNTYGYSADEVIGQHANILRSPDATMERARDFLPGTSELGWRGEIMNRKKDGTLFPILLSTSLILDDNENPIALIGVAMDITEMRSTREELIAAKELAEENNHLKTAFLNNMSHEIRTPMNHIMGFSSLMAEAKGNDKDSYSDIILNSSNQLLSLIEDIILLSRLQSEKIEMDLNDFSPKSLLTSILEKTQNDESKKLISWHLGVPKEYQQLSIHADFEKIKQILIILISNALKYTFEGSIELGFQVQSGILTFYVEDTGIGIPAQEQSKIYDSFYRGDQAISLVIGGTGLGLSIAKELVRALNSKLELSSVPGKGSIFSFSIPIALSAAMPLARKNSHTFQLPMNELSILIADDEMINFLYLEILLKGSVKRLDHALNGKVALDMAIKNRYDLILMDLKMPVMDGFNATRELKLRFPQIPVIAQTAYSTPEDKTLAILAGCDDFIPKPIKKDILMEIIQKYI